MMRKTFFVLAVSPLFVATNTALSQNLQVTQAWKQLDYVDEIKKQKSQSLSIAEDLSSEQKEIFSKYTEAILALDRNDLEIAEKYLNEALKVKELQVYVYYYLGVLEKKRGDFNKAIHNFERSLRLKPQHDLERKTEYDLAKIYWKKNNLRKTRSYLNRARKSYKGTEVHPEILWNLLVVDSQRGSSSQCYWFENLFESYPDYNSQVAAWNLNPKSWKLIRGAGAKTVDIPCSRKIGSRDRRSHIMQLVVLGEYQRARQEVEDPSLDIKDFERLSLKTDFELRAGDPRQAFRDLDAKYEEYKTDRDYLRLYTKTASRSMNHEKALKAYDQRISLRRSRGGKAYVTFRKGFLEYEMGRYAQAYESFKKVIEIYPRSTYQGDVYWYLGWVSYLQKNYDQAIDHFEYLLSRIENNQHFRSKDYYTKERIKYWLAQSYSKKGVATIAEAHFKEIVGEEGLGYYAFLAASQLGSEQTKVKVNKGPQPLKNKANPLLDNLKLPWVLHHNQSGAGVLAQDEHSNWAHSLASLGTGGLQEVEAANLDQKQKEQATNINLVMGRRLASQSLQKNMDQYFDKSRFQPYIKRFKALAQLGFRKEAKWELYEMEKRSRSKEEKKALAELYLQVDDIYRSTKIFTLNFGDERREPAEYDDSPLALWSSTYPQPHKNLVEVTATSFEVPENLVYSIMRAESFYRHSAMSGAGARGLLQLMPFTASRVANLLNLQDDFDPDQLFEPSVNIQLGVRYMKRLLEAFKGDKILAIAAYNAGPHRAEWWVNQFGNLRQDEFIEHILFLETRNYVKKVMKFNWIYSLLYNNDTINVAEMKQPLDFQLTRRPALTEQW